jgi:Transposase DDE domain/Transposase DNA-binding
MVERINSFPDFTGLFGDKRIDKRAQEALNKLVLGRSSSIRQVSESRSQQKAFYRLLDNEKFSEDNIEQGIINRCRELCFGRHVLCIQDTSEMNLEAHRGRIKQGSGIGKTTKEGILGFFLHPCFVIDAEKQTALGYSYIDLWHREQEGQDRHEREYKKQPIETKESYKWIQTVEQSRNVLVNARLITVVADREADIYDLFGRYGTTDIKLLIRSNSNRQINDGDEKIIEYLSEQPVKHNYTIEINGDIRKGIQKRKAVLELKWGTVELRKPGSCKDTSVPSKVLVTVVEAKEKKGNIYWRLYTTHEVKTAEQALQIIEWYKQRWYIEQVFRLLKLQGFQIENSQLETGWAIRKLTMLALLAALRIMQMLIAYEDDNEQSIAEAFTKDEQQCMEQLNQKLEGQTDKLHNPHKPVTLKWATWIIARLGGWKGYVSQRKPGPIILHRGFIKFYQLYEGWTLAQNFFKDVGTQ